MIEAPFDDDDGLDGPHPSSSSSPPSPSSSCSPSISLLDRGGVVSMVELAVSLLVRAVFEELECEFGSAGLEGWVGAVAVGDGMDSTDLLVVVPSGYVDVVAGLLGKEGLIGEGREEEEEGLPFVRGCCRPCRRCCCCCCCCSALSTHSVARCRR